MAEVFQRLLGLETEYAIRAPAQDAAATRPSKFRHYESLITALRQRIPVVPAKHFKEGVFTASGGAVWFEAERPAAGGGLIEGATPECRGPREAVTYQRAQDRLLAEAARDRGFQLLKNDRDARGNVYGAQENYEATLATGGHLFLWRLGLVCLFPLAVLTWLGMLGFLIATLLYFALAALIYVPIKVVTGGRESIALFLFGHDLVNSHETCICVPAWLESILQFATRLITAPLAIVLYGLLHVTAFRRVRHRLTPFLLSRPILAGAGLLDEDGRFQLADKGPAINCILGFGGMIGDRPIFSLGHFFKAVYADAWFAPREYAELFAQRQRLQIGLGDSNMCETAEYLRVSTTLLVLDAIEANCFEQPPVVRRAIRGLHAVCRDVTLTQEIPLVDGQRWTALRIQRYYLAGCRAFLDQQTNVPEEAWNVVHLWERLLDGLEQAAEAHEFPETLVGSIDWVTKKYLLDHAGTTASWAERKKIDLRYHELSEMGYFAMLESAGQTKRIIDDEAIHRAMRLPPPNSPATARGHYIREFAHADEPVTANWKVVVIGDRWSGKVVRLAKYGHAQRRSPTAPRSKRSRHATPPDAE